MAHDLLEADPDDGFAQKSFLWGERRHRALTPLLQRETLIPSGRCIWGVSMMWAARVGWWRGLLPGLAAASRRR